MPEFPLHLLGGLFAATTLPAATLGQWIDLTDESGLGQNSVALLKFADLNNDSRADIVMQPESRNPVPPTVFLQDADYGENGLPAFTRFEQSGLPPLASGDIIVFADLDNDGLLDAIAGLYLDIYQDDYTVRLGEPSRTSWLKGRGDGTFGEPIPLQEAQLATTRSLAVGDINADGLPDLFIGNWYERYFSGYESFSNDLLLQYPGDGGAPAFVRWPLPEETLITGHEEDLGGRPTYGVALPVLDDGLPMLLELNYGRRWNRLYEMRHREPIRPPRKDIDSAPLVLQDPRAAGAHLVRMLRGREIAPQTNIDGDAIRHGRHPSWPQAHAEAQPRSLREDEEPFRANGNTFDSAVGDIDNDGDFDLFLSTIIHAWAGESSDRSRFLVNQLEETGRLHFLSFEHLSVDRVPDLTRPGEPLDPVVTNDNQGDIFAELADLNHDGRLDLVLCSSSYPDPPPYDERLRIYFQQIDGRFRDVTAELGIDHVGAGMPSLADVDGDGDLDLVVGQTFNRLPADQRRAAAITSGALAPNAPEDARPQPRARLFINNSPGDRKAVLIDIVGDPSQSVTREAFGTIVRLTADLDGDPETPEVTQSRQVLGPGGHAGKQHPRTVHFGLNLADKASVVEITWPGEARPAVRLESLAAGHYRYDQASGTLEPLP